MERLAPGLYLNYNLQWLRIPNIQEIVESSIANVMELAYATNSGLLTNTETGAGASILRIRTAGTTENETSIKINETGKYIFMFRLYGGPNSTEVNYRYNEYYLYIYNKTTSQVVGKTMMVALDNDKFNTYSATLYTPDLNENDEIDIRIGHVSGSRTWSLVSNPSTNANRTSFVFWKIQ
ncbi:MAG: hypothetical protein ACLVKO_06855 [Dysgonomonas sp.]